MGKAKKEKKHSRKKSKKEKTGHETSEDEWIEKPVLIPDTSAASNLGSSSAETSREEWMTSAGSQLDLLFSMPASDKKTARELEKEKNDAIALSRELNPDLNPNQQQKKIDSGKNRGYEFGDSGSAWRMMKLRRVFETAKADNRRVEDVALERYGSIEVFEEAQIEQDYLESLKRSNREQSGISDRNYVSSSKSKFARSTSFQRPSRFKEEREVTNPERGRFEHKKRTVNLPSVSDGVVNTGNLSDNTGDILSLDELNVLKAKSLKASLMNASDASDLEERFQKESAKYHSKINSKSSSVVVLPKVDLQGRFKDIGSSSGQSVQNLKRKRGQEINPSDEMTEVSDLLLREKLGNDNSFDEDFANQIAQDSTFSNNLDYIEDRADKLASSKLKSEEKKRSIAIRDHHRTQTALDKCPYCYDPEEGRRPKVSVIALGTRAYLALPQNIDMVTGHCLIIPSHHASSSLECEDEVWEEMKNFMKCLIQMFAAQSKSVIFMEQVINFKWMKHAVIECIPVDDDIFDMAPGFFKEAILNSDEEWSQHKKLIDTSQNGIRRSMVKNLPFFHVWFTPNGGLGHVIEDQHSWTEWFGKEVIAGMMDLPSEKWRKARRADQEESRTRYEKFVAKWKDYDWTNLISD
ncbi:hypothetical protein HK096_006224 [Nowakowskiella sp. JEL0078]|nr:hypothetical protein HK096_006224 [Nowakowskiella sp. JEL0078]